MRDTAKAFPNGLVPQESFNTRTTRSGLSGIRGPVYSTYSFPTLTPARRRNRLYHLWRLIARRLYRRNRGSKGAGVVTKLLDACLALASLYVVVSILGGTG